jgi:hypothetical protein
VAAGVLKRKHVMRIILGLVLVLLARRAFEAVYVLRLPAIAPASEAGQRALDMWDQADPDWFTGTGRRHFDRLSRYTWRLLAPAVVSERVYPEAVLITKRRLGPTGFPMLSELFFVAENDSYRLDTAFDIPTRDFRRRSAYWAERDSFDAGWAVFFFRPGEFSLEEVQLFAKAQHAYFEAASRLLQLSPLRPFRYFLYVNPHDIEYLGYIQTFALALPHRDEIHVVPRQYTGPHEEIHVLTHQLGRPPILFVEGLAVYLESAIGRLDVPRLGPTGERPTFFDPLRAQAVLWDIPSRHRRALSFVQAGSRLSQLAGTWRVSPATYALGGSFFAYLSQQFGFGPVKAFYALASGDLDQAARQAFNLTFTELESQWLVWLRANFE